MSVHFSDGETISHTPTYGDPPFGNPDHPGGSLDDKSEPPLAVMVIRVESNGDLTIRAGGSGPYTAPAGEWDAVTFELLAD